MPLYEVVDEQGLLRPALRGLEQGGLYHGGNASLVEAHLGLSGEEILYVGDHVFVDVNMSKSLLRWRTALVLHELEGEIRAILAFAPEQARLNALMADKEEVQRTYTHLRLLLQRAEHGYGEPPELSVGELQRRLSEVRSKIAELDGRIAPLARQSAELVNRRWGPLMRTGNDKSHLARQVERYADIYMSRVSNFLHATPFVYLRSPRGSLPHDPGTSVTLGE
jgi:hypothetical protein